MRTCLLPLLVAALAVACDRQPVAPDVESPLFSAAKSDVLFEGTDDFQDYVRCANGGAGEVLHWYGPWRITGRAVTSNSGNVHEQWDLEYLDGFTITGLTSADTWTVLQSRFNNTTHSLKNDNWVRTTVYVETYENQDGERMFVQTTLHFTVVDGVWRAVRVAISACSLK